ncbi:PH domain-containing protein [Dietzia sp. SL131]|uniref:PH domain-containing protein n=1 Tax=unclassified Dietzia TaxID=2617939 RepID=UPI0013D35EAB|nr:MULTISPECIES: PH domain-containing protein [unclassified Dietzia]MCY1657374.1 PH domain-containing protein [Dietzia sp. SL131]
MNATQLGLRPPRERVDPRCRRWWTAQVALWMVGPLLVLAASTLIVGPWMLLATAGWALLTAAALVVVPRVRWAIHRWEATDTAVYSRSGLFWEEWRAAPLSRVQTVDKTRGPLQRQFGLATVVVTTASSKGAVRISALDATQAEEMADRLTLLAEDDQRDAT